MKKVIICFLALFPFVLDIVAEGQSDSALQRQLIGTWLTEDLNLETGVRTRTGMWIVMPNSTFRYEWTNAFPSKVQWVTSEGKLKVKDGYLIQTITNVVAHGRPASEQDRLPEGGVTGRTKIIRLNNRELELEPNPVSGKIVYKKLNK